MKNRKETVQDPVKEKSVIDIRPVYYTKQVDCTKCVVSRIMPDGAKTPIGYIEDDFSDGEDPLSTKLSSNIIFT